MNPRPLALTSLTCLVWLACNDTDHTAVAPTTTPTQAASDTTAGSEPSPSDPSATASTSGSDATNAAPETDLFGDTDPFFDPDTATADTQTPVDSGPATQPADTTTTDPDTTAGCAGDWRLGSTFMHGSEIGVPCAPNDAPQNCATGDFITFADGECICIARCAALQNIVVGDACNPSGSWKCQPILATNPDANSGEYCVPLEWNLCQGTPDHHNPQCTVNGANCDFDTECCSGWCSSDTGMCE